MVHMGDSRSLSPSRYKTGLEERIIRPCDSRRGWGDFQDGISVFLACLLAGGPFTQMNKLGTRGKRFKIGNAVFRSPLINLKEDIWEEVGMGYCKQKHDSHVLDVKSKVEKVHSRIGKLKLGRVRYNYKAEDMARAGEES